MQPHNAALPQLPQETYLHLVNALLSLQRSSSHLNPESYPDLWPPPAAPQDTTTTQDIEDTASIAEDKRRRNTVASARFRVKKKLRTLNLERTVADLTGRTEELEREATDLRRENAWLKEIVLLKGRNLYFASQAPALGAQGDEDEDRAVKES